MRLFAFEGIRYTPVAGDVAELAALPYDQIDDSLRIRYHVKSPQQFVQLTRPVAAPGGNEYQSAAALHRQWLDEGIVVRDERPALYPYVIQLQDGGERLGVAGLVALEDDPATDQPEQPPADRLALLEAMRVDLEPAFLLADDDGRLDELIREDVHRLTPLVHHEDPDGNLHVIYRLDDPARIALYQQAVAGPARIVGGHAVYQAARSFARSQSAQPRTAAAAKLAVVTSSQAAGRNGDLKPGVMSGLVWADHDSKVL